MVHLLTVIAAVADVWVNIAISFLAPDPGVPVALINLTESRVKATAPTLKV